MEESHFLTMMRMVQPHVSGRPRRSVELMLQSADLLHSVRQYREPELSACDAGQDFIDFEAMLTDLQTVCNPAEAEFVNLILNFFRSRKIYSAYRTATAAASQQNFQQSFQQNLQQSQTTQEHFQEEKEGLSAELDAADPSASATLLAANGPANAAPPSNNPQQGTADSPPQINRHNAKRTSQPVNTFRSLMENQALQSLLSPAQKENLNQIESLMQVLS